MHQRHEDCSVSLHPTLCAGSPNSNSLRDMLEKADRSAPSSAADASEASVLLHARTACCLPIDDSCLGRDLRHLRRRQKHKHSILRLQVEVVCPRSVCVCNDDCSQAHGYVLVAQPVDASAFQVVNGLVQTLQVLEGRLLAAVRQANHRSHFGTSLRSDPLDGSGHAPEFFPLLGCQFLSALARPRGRDPEPVDEGLLSDLVGDPPALLHESYLLSSVAAGMELVDDDH